MASSIALPPVLIRCKGILFDMDGILISSLGSVERSWTKWANRRGIDPAYACRMAHGCRSIETVAKLRPDLDSEAENKIIEDMEVEDTEGITLLPGVLDLLAALPRDRWTVVTSEIGYIAKQFPELSEAQRNEVGEFLHQLDEHDDVHRVWAALK